MLQADDGEFKQQLSMRTVPRDYHRVRGRVGIPAGAKSLAAAEDVTARFHRSLGIVSR
jgi:hypothetical protein